MPQDYFPSGPFLSQWPDHGEFDVLREDFLLGFAERTARAYKTDLEEFWDWCVAQEVDPLTAADVEVAQFEVSLTAGDLAASSVARRLSAVRGFIRHIHGSRAK